MMIKNIAELIDNMTPDIFESLKRAVELGKWPSGEAISKEQRSLCMQAVIAYEQKNIAPEQRTGYIPPKSHTHCGSTDGQIVDDEVQPLNLK